jgi:hypothetical protein
VRRLFESRIAAVAIGAAVVVGLGATGAVAAGMVGSADIRDESIRAVDINDGAVASAELRGGAVGSGEIGDGEIRWADLTSFVKDESDDTEDIQGVRDRVSDLDTRVTTLEGTEPETLNTLGHLLYGSPDETTTVTYQLAEPVALSDFNLEFFQERVLGSGSYGASLVLGVDVDGSGGYESDDAAWGASHDPADLGDDTFVAMDGSNPDNVKVDARQVPQWWSPNAAGTGSNNVDASCYNTLTELIENCEDVRFSADSTVEIVRFTMGGSPAWVDEAVRFTVLDERLSLAAGE